MRLEEIVKVCGEIGSYRGRPLTEDRIRQWLQQFGDNKSQRLMFRILQNLSYYDSTKIRTKLKEAHGIVLRRLTTRLEASRRRRSDILVSYMDRVGKSGALYAKLYADENQVYIDNVVERNKLRATIAEREDLQAIVLLDDFIGTGETAASYLRELSEECGDVLQDKKLRLIFVSLTGFAAVVPKIKRAASSLDLEVHICDPLDQTAHCFHDQSAIFPEMSDRNAAMNLPFEKGAVLEKRHPVGYGDCQATVVFEHNCPNNTLPVLWSSSGTWEPLFPRR